MNETLLYSGFSKNKPCSSNDLGSHFDSLMII